MSRWSMVVALILGTLLFSWPAMVNGGPFFFPDTSSYIRGADAAVVVLTSKRSAWSDHLVLDSLPTDTQRGTRLIGEGRPPASAETSVRPTRPIMLNRSIYFGIFLYAFLLAVGGLGTVLVIAALAAATIILVILGMPIGDRRRRRLWAIASLLVLGLLTPLPYFASRLMMDTFSGLMVAALASLILFWREHSRFARAWLLTICMASAAFHTTHALLALLIGIMGVVVVRRGRADLPRTITVAAAPVIAAAAGHFLFIAAIRQETGNAPISPPFLSARLIDDGPGFRQLKIDCGRRPWALCPYLDRMPQGSDTFLWSRDKRIGVFMAVDDASQRRIGQQDLAFAMRVIAEQPVEVAKSSLMSIFRQASALELEHFNYSPEELAGYRSNLPAPVFDEVRHTAAAHGTMPVRPTLYLSVTAAGIALLFLVAFAILNRRGLMIKPELAVARYAILLAMALLINVAICGAMSTPHGRYHMRMLWLLPFGALLVLAGDDMSTRHQREDYD